MKSLKILVILGTVLGLNYANADENLPEKATDKVHDTKREMKKKAHRGEEKSCAESDAECLAKKAKNRSTEAGDAVKDKATETKNKVD